jgi:hypothetical protein
VQVGAQRGREVVEPVGQPVVGELGGGHDAGRG